MFTLHAYTGTSGRRGGGSNAVVPGGGDTKPLGSALSLSSGVAVDESIQLGVLAI